MIWENEYVNLADFGLKKWKMTQNLLEILTPVSSFWFFNSLMLESQRQLVE